MTSLAAAAACLALLVVKALLVPRLNINWDEFNFLHHVHQGARGELTLFLQGGYTHLFEWLVRVPGDEADQIVAARVPMLALLAISVVLLWRIAAELVSREAALFAPLCYLSMWPVLRHGASFRYDSLLLPLTLLTILLVMRARASRKFLLAAGVCLGLAGFISIKAIFLVPVLAVLQMAPPRPPQTQAHGNPFGSIALLGFAAAGTAAVLLFLHGLGLADHVSAQRYVAMAAGKTLAENPLFPRQEVFSRTLSEDWLGWMLVFGGAAWAMARPALRPAAACGLALIPVLVYRNAWPYYYVVMLAPSCVLASVALEGLLAGMRRTGADRWTPALHLALGMLLLFHAIEGCRRLWYDGQAEQRRLIAAVHQIFPDPVPYLDTSGMMASFRKVNFFMSSLGVENYRDSGRGFVAPALAAYQPPLLLANRPVLDPASSMFRRLLPEDRTRILESYVPYWGPVWIAGAPFELKAYTVVVRVPFPGRYRLESSASVMVNGTRVHPGGEVSLSETAIVAPVAELADGTAVSGRLVIASAKPPPLGVPIRQSAIFADL